jgi:hypothetical protein
MQGKVGSGVLFNLCNNKFGLQYKEAGINEFKCMINGGSLQLK